MIAIVEHVAVIFVVWQQLRKFYKQGTFGLHSLKTVSKQLKSATCANFFQEKLIRIQLLYTLLLLSAPSLSGGLILRHVIQLQLKVTNTLLWQSITLPNGTKLCQHI